MRLLGFRKFRCESCGRASWSLPEITLWRRTSSRHDPVATRVRRHHWRRKAAIILIAVLGGTGIGLAVAHWQETVSAAETSDP